MNTQFNERQGSRLGSEQPPSTAQASDGSRAGPIGAPHTAQFRLRSYEFRRERAAGWEELEGLVKRVEKRGIGALDAAELQRLPALYRGVLSSLSVARAISLDKNVIQYLEGLSARAYFAIYCRRRFLGQSVFHFFVKTFPESVRRIRWALALSIGVMLLGIVAGFALTQADPQRFFSFVDVGLADDRTPDATRETLEATLYTPEDSATELARFATFLFTHNARIGLLCFAVGFIAGVPVLLVLFANGAMLGAMWAIFAAKGLGYDFFAWVMPHGVTELLAVILCGAAGLSMGYGLVFPGRFRRLDNLALRGRHAGSLAVGAMTAVRTSTSWTSCRNRPSINAAMKNRSTAPTASEPAWRPRSARLSSRRKRPGNTRP